jgi:hypothetical protein
MLDDGRVIDNGVNIRSKAANALCFLFRHSLYEAIIPLINGVDVLS